MRPAAVLFDCDGVLADTEALHNRIIAEELTALGWPMDAHGAERFVGLAWPAILPQIEAKLGPGRVPPDLLERIVARVMEGLHGDVPAVPGMRDAMAAILAAGVPVAVASNSSRAELALKLRALGLEQVFAGRTFSVDDVARAKPAPDMYRAAAAACGADPAACVVIEDSPAGARAGLAAGCRVLGFARATPAAALRAAGAEIFTDMGELPGLLQVAPVGALG